MQDSVTHLSAVSSRKALVRERFACARALLILALAAASSTSAAEYRLKNLGEIIGPNSYAQGVNNQGQVVGYWYTPTGACAFLYSGGVVTNLAPLGPANHYALSINQFGQVAGFSERTNSTEAFVFSEGTLTYLGTLGGLNSYANGINAKAEIVGYLDTTNGSQAFLLSHAGFFYLGTLGGADSFAFGVNQRTQVTGSSGTGPPGLMNAFVWENGVLLNLNDLLPPDSAWVLQEARGINDLGAIAGWGRHGGEERAYLFSAGSIVDLGLLEDGTNSYALGLNNFNQVVGGASARGRGQRAFLWHEGTMSDLNDLVRHAQGWELREARGINDYGQIVGWGVLRGSEMAFLLEPIVDEASGSARDAMPERTRVPAGVFLLSGSSGPTTNSPLADAHVRDGGSADSNFGTSTVLELQNSSTSGNSRDLYFKFNVSNTPIPLGSANLRVWASLSANGSVTATAYSVSDTNWTETGITWNNKPTLGTELTNATFNVRNGAWYNIDVSTFVRAEQAAGREVVTIALHSTNTSSLLTSINSKENASNKPILILNTNAQPIVTITSPADGSAFPGPTNLTVNATATDSDGTVTQVQFFAETVLIGTDATSPYSVVWSAAPIGTWALTARASDDLGRLATSAVVNVTITTNLVTIDDAHVTSASPNSNFGSETVMEVQTNGASGPTKDTYMKFNISGVTGISNATLRIFASASAANGSVSATAYGVSDTNWQEGAITFNNRPALGTALSSKTISGSTLQWHTFDVTTFVKERKAAGDGVLTLAVHSQTNNTRYIKINSGEAASNPPELLIATTNIPPAIAITAPAGGALFIRPVDVTVAATASDADGSVSQVEFFADSTSLGVDNNSPYSVVWNNAPSGSFSLTARATDSWGRLSTSAVVSVTVDQPPSVDLTAPANGANFPVYPTNIALTATASDSDGTVSQVEFFHGSTSIGIDASSPYSYTWSNVTAGVYGLTARATDNAGAVSTSVVHTVTVDVLPEVSITSPSIGTNFILPTNVTVTATASDSDGTISQVDFYAGTICIGGDQTSPYSVTWTNASAGVFALTARATDNLGGTATSAAVYITNNFAPTNLSGLRLWLDAATGLTTNASGQISRWLDLSGNDNVATQNVSSSQATVIHDALNGRPVARFDAFDDHFRFHNNPLTDMTEGEVFAIVKTAVDFTNNYRVLWYLGASDVTYYPTYWAVIRETFGTTVSREIGDPAQPLNQYHLYNVAASSSAWSARFNGVLQYSTTNNTVQFGTSPRLGNTCCGQGLDGDIAEMLIYNRTLTVDERDAIGRYLGGKYALVNGPAAPTNLSATAISSNQVSLVWNATVGNAATKFVVERKIGVNGIYARVAVVDQGRSWLDNQVSAGTQYFYRVKTVNYSGESDYSNEAGATPADGFAPMPTADLAVWLKGDAGHAVGNISAWEDQSGRGNHAVQTASESPRPLVVENGVNGRPVVRFDAFDDHFLFQNNPLSEMTQGEVFAVLKTAADVTNNYRTLWYLGVANAADYPTYWGVIRDSFGSAAVRDIGDPPVPLNQPHLYNVAASSAEWTARLNGLTQYTTTTNTVQFRTTPRLGNLCCGQSFDGDMAEVLIYNRTLTVQERDAVGTYLNEKYQFMPSGGPIQLTAHTLSPSQVALSWRQSGSTPLSVYVIDRRLGTNGVFQPIAKVTGDWRYFDAGLSANTVYSYRVRNAFVASPNSFSTVVAAQTLASGADFPLSSVAVWLRAQDLDLTNTAPVSTWTDFWTTNLAAVQTNAPDRPGWLSIGLSNTQPAVQFGGGTFLQLPSVLTNKSAAEIFAVLASSTNAPATNQGLWKFSTNAASYFPTTSGGVEDAFGSTVARANVAPLPDLRVPMVYGVAADTNLWRSRMNGPVKQSSTANTVTFSGTPWLGRSLGGAAEPFSGVVGELIIFNRVLTLAEQKTVRDALALKFALTLELPHVPSNLTLARTNTLDSVLHWNAIVGSENGLESHFVVERQSNTNSPFVPLASLSRTEVTYLDSSGLPEIPYRYRLRVVNDVGETSSSPLSAALPDTDGDGLSDYLEGQLGTNANSSDTDGDGLPDAWEVAYGLNPLNSTGRDGASGDFDNDGLTNLLEYQQGSNPADGIIGDDPAIRLQVYRPN